MNDGCSPPGLTWNPNSTVSGGLLSELGLLQGRERTPTTPLVQQLVSRCFKQMQGTDIRTHIRLVALGRIFNQIPTSAVTDQWEIHVVSPSAYLVVLEMFHPGSPIRRFSFM